MSTLDSKFVSQKDLDEKRQKRQEEWDKVRKPEQPVEAPEEEEADRRCLYDRLQEQKDRKQSEHDEQHKLKNQVRGLDREEADFLDFVSQRQQELENERMREEEATLALLREPVVKPAVEKPATSGKQSSAGHSAKPAVHLGPKKRTQAEILSRVVKRKRSDADEKPDTKKVREDSESENSSDSGQAVDNAAEAFKEEARDNKTDVKPLDDISSDQQTAVVGKELAVARVIGVLPGIGVYSASSDSESSSSDSEIDVDVFRRSLSKDVEKLIQAARQH